MVFYIVLLRALAACLITNSHYGDIYPTSILAVGGLIGDILFFAISGWCLYRVRDSFPRWYGKRLLRVFPPVIIITAIYLLLGQYALNGRNLFELFLYPTEYHFVASIVLLYIPYYIVMKIKLLRNNLPIVMAAVAAIFSIIYIFFYDKSYYHIDVVEEPMIRFLFAESMLLGAWFRQNDEKFRNRFNPWSSVALILLFIGYLGSKVLFDTNQNLASWQVINQVIIFALLFSIMWLFAGIDRKLNNLPSFLKKTIEFISKLTLEIYIVQHVIIRLLTNTFVFPINWIVVTAAIIVAAFALHSVWKYTLFGIEKLLAHLKNSKNSSVK